MSDHRPWTVPPSAQFKASPSDDERLVLEKRKAELELMRQLKIRKPAV